LISFDEVFHSFGAEVPKRFPTTIANDSIVAQASTKLVGDARPTLWDMRMEIKAAPLCESLVFKDISLFTSNTSKLAHSLHPHLSTHPHESGSKRAQGAGS
jgi:hypothetical protein